jgi:hypothetical protein
LGLRRRRGHAPDRRVDKECGAFVHGVPVAGKAKTAELIEKAVVESAGALEPIDVGGKEVKIFEEIPAPAAATINPVCRRGYWGDLGKAVGPRMTNGFVLLWPKVDSLGKFWSETVNAVGRASGTLWQRSENRAHQWRRSYRHRKRLRRAAHCRLRKNCRRNNYDYQKNLISKKRC